MTDRVDCVVIGAGVVGLAVARAWARAGHETIVLEAADAVGTVTSARTSEVIHSGIYYPTGSLKARLCTAGRRLLYAYCRDHQVPHWRCGKLIVATDPGQTAALRALQQQAAANGVEDVHWLDAASARALEPELSCVAALQSGQTGIVDSHAYMRELQGDLEAAGGMVALQSPVRGDRVDAAGGELLLQVDSSPPMELLARHVINCAGLSAQAVAQRMQGLPPASIPPAFYAKGNYFALAQKAPFSRLIYPVPEPGGLGVHLTLDLARQARFGPDVEWVQRIVYAVDEARARAFYAAIRRYWPALPEGALHADYAGVRPKIVGPGEPAADFVIQGAATHGVAGLVNLYGIESPGLTASLAIAQETLAHAR